MNLDDLLRNALHDERTVDSPGRDGWDDVRARAGRVHRRRQRGRAAAALTAVTALVATLGVFVVGGGDDPAPNVAAGPFEKDQVVALVRDQLVVLSPDDGRVIRVLVDGIQPTLTFGGITATPDGETVYFTRLRRDLPCDRQEINEVSVRDGGSRPFRSPGTSPLMSPDGKTLAFASSACDADTSASLVLHDLDSEFETSYSTGVPASRGSAQPLSWSPDGQRLLVGIYGDPSAPNPEMPLVKVFDVATGAFTPLGPSEATDTAAFLPDGQVIVSFHVDGGHRIVALNDDRTVGETLLESPTAGVLQSMRVSASGEVLLHFGGTVLQRWVPGNEPVTLVDGLVRDAAWLPASSVTDETPATTAAPLPVSVEGRTGTTRSDPQPETLFAIRDRSLVELSADEGSVVRVVTTEWPFIGSGDSLTVTNDRRFAYLSGRLGEPIDPLNPRLDSAMVRVDLATGAIERLGDGRWPSVTPDGSKLAYFPTNAAQAVIRDLATGVESASALDGVPTEEVTVAPVSWDPTSRYLVVRVRDARRPLDPDPTEQLWMVDTESAVSRQLDAAGFDGPFDLMPLGETGRWVAVVSRDDDVDRIVEFDPAPGTVGRTLLELDDGFAKFMNAELLDSDPSGRHLLFTFRQPPNPGSTGSVWRWSEGDEEPTKLGAGYQGGAAW